MLEWGFDMIYTQMCTMMTHLVLHENLKTSLWPECVEIATNLEIIMVNPHEERCAYENFHGKIPDYKKYLKTLG